MTTHERTIRTIAATMEIFFKIYADGATPERTEAAREEYIRLDTILAILTSGPTAAAAINAGRLILIDERSNAEIAIDAPPRWSLQAA